MHIIFANFVIRLLFLFYFLTGSLTILNPFGFFACSVVRKLPYRKYGAMFLFYAKKKALIMRRMRIIVNSGGSAPFHPVTYLATCCILVLCVWPLNGCPWLGSYNHALFQLYQGSSLHWTSYLRELSESVGNADVNTSHSRSRCNINESNYKIQDNFGLPVLHVSKRFEKRRITQ